MYAANLKCLKSCNFLLSYSYVIWNVSASTVNEIVWHDSPFPSVSTLFVMSHCLNYTLVWNVSPAVDWDNEKGKCNRAEKQISHNLFLSHRKQRTENELEYSLSSMELLELDFKRSAVHGIGPLGNSVFRWSWFLYILMYFMRRSMRRWDEVLRQWDSTRRRWGVANSNIISYP